MRMRSGFVKRLAVWQVTYHWDPSSPVLLPHGKLGMGGHMGSPMQSDSRVDDSRNSTSQHLQ